MRAHTAKTKGMKRIAQYEISYPNFYRIFNKNPSREPRKAKTAVPVLPARGKTAEE
jgi:hypothetical protein